MSTVRNRVSKLEQARGDEHPRFLIAHGVRGREAALALLEETGVKVTSRDVVDWLTDAVPPTVEIVPTTMGFEEALALLDAEDRCVAPLKNNQRKSRCRRSIVV